MKKHALIFILSLFATLQLLAAEAFTFGAEWEFSHPSIQSEWENGGQIEAAKAKLLYVENIREICATVGCTVDMEYGKWGSMQDHTQAADYKVTFADGWWFKISHDPECVEITTKPSTIEELKSRAKLINEVVFKSGKKLGFTVPENDNAHFNIGFMRAFNNNGDLFLRFFTDYHNRPELALGAIGHDIYNGPPLSIMHQEMRAALSKIVLEHNANPQLTAKQLAVTIEKNVYLQTYQNTWSKPRHYQMIGLKYMSSVMLEQLEQEDRPFELRAIWAQKNVEQFILLGELFEARINYLKTQSGPISYTESQTFIASKIDLAASFYNYVTESGLDYEKFKALLPADLQALDSRRVEARAQKMSRDLNLKIKGQNDHINSRSCSALFAG
ncbi:hypothetical protein CIK05_11570 [Bdellovibrio sp. qaytius]|nr:hypothetical protein CIK05_11570 [Bdellovibrio sp. qaytius]